MRLTIIVVGRNEGDRLRRCLDATVGLGVPVVYVDSGSVDGSPALARDRGATVVELDSSSPFTAGRARNAGFQRALELDPELELVQFVDGDCELVPGWLECGEAELSAGRDIAVVCGRVRERNRDASVYNRLCDLEWQAVAGEARACGGNAMVRVSAFRQMGGFAPFLIAGEEPELCLRLRREGWRIRRSDHEMVRHDAAMMRFGEWWRRMLRAGWAFAEGAALHGREPEKHWVRESRSILWWGAVLPGFALLLAWPTGGLSLLLLAGYPVLGARVYRGALRRGVSPGDARLQALFTVIGKFPQLMGWVQHALLRRRRLVDWRTAGGGR